MRSKGDTVQQHGQPEKAFSGDPSELRPEWSEEVRHITVPREGHLEQKKPQLQGLSVETCAPGLQNNKAHMTLAK